MLLTLMMLPLPLAAIPGANAATRKNAARTLLANSASNVSTLRSGVAPNQENPALLTRMSISPTALTRRWRSAGSLRSAPTKRAWPPAAVIASTVSAPRAASRPWTMISPPSRLACIAGASVLPGEAAAASAVAGQLQGYCTADPGRRARHERLLTLEVTRLGRGHCCSPKVVVHKPLGAHNSAVSVMVPDQASVDPSRANALTLRLNRVVFLL